MEIYRGCLVCFFVEIAWKEGNIFLPMWVQLKENVSKCLITDPYLNWEDIMDWGERELKGERLKATLCRLSSGAVVYNVWKQRNDVKHDNQIKSEEKIV